MIISTTIANNSEEIIGDALLSVLPVVDACMIIDTGITDDTFKVAARICGDKLVTRRFTWTNDFAAARNAALLYANEFGADWALTVDTDERLLVDIGYKADRRDPTTLGCDVVLCADESGSYMKERLIHLPATGKWRGRVHEAFVPYPEVTRKIYDGWRVAELPKTPEQLKAKFERDQVSLQKMTEEHPDDARWWFYLGETCKNLGNVNGASVSYLNTFSLSSWDEETAWSAYRLAEIACISRSYDDAIDHCILSLRAHPGLAEAAWLAGWCSYQLGKDRDAIFWSRMARAIAKAEKEPSLRRIGFRYAPAYNEGPADVEAWARKRLNGEIKA